MLVRRRPQVSITFSRIKNKTRPQLFPAISQKLINVPLQT